MAKIIRRYNLGLESSQSLPCQSGQVVEVGWYEDNITSEMLPSIWRAEQDSGSPINLNIVLVGEGETVPGASFTRRGSFGLNNERRTVLQVYTN